MACKSSEEEEHAMERVVAYVAAQGVCRVGDPAGIERKTVVWSVPDQSQDRLQMAEAVSRGERVGIAGSVASTEAVAEAFGEGGRSQGAGDSGSASSLGGSQDSNPAGDVGQPGSSRRQHDSRDSATPPASRPEGVE